MSGRTSGRRRRRRRSPGAPGPGTVLVVGVLVLDVLLGAPVAPAPVAKAAASTRAAASDNSSPVSRGRSANLLARSGMAAQCNQVRSGTAQAGAEPQPDAHQHEAQRGGQPAVIAGVGQLVRWSLDAIVAVGVVGSLAVEVLATGVTLVVGVGGGVLVAGCARRRRARWWSSSWACSCPGRSRRTGRCTAGHRRSRHRRQASPRGPRGPERRATACRSPTNGGCAPMRVWQPRWRRARLHPKPSFCRISCRTRSCVGARRRVMLGWLPPYPQPS